MKRPRGNEPERLLEALASSKGWRPTKRGWPDFMCINEMTGEIIAVEVKPRINGEGSRTQLLKRDQAACMDFLTKHGIRCFVSDGLTLEPYDRERHASEKERARSRAARIARQRGFSAKGYPSQR